MLFILLTFIFLCGQVISNRSVDFPINESLDTYDFFCENNTSLSRDFVTCGLEKNEVLVNPLICLSIYKLGNGTATFLAGKCPFIPSKNVFSLSLPKEIVNVSNFDQDIMCSHSNRSGVMCSRCNESSSLSFNSLMFKCMPADTCYSYYWIIFILAPFIPLTLLFYTVIIFDINLASGYAYTFLFFAQTASSRSVAAMVNNGLLYLKNKNYIHAYIPVRSLYSLFNLDFNWILGEKFCSGNDFNTRDIFVLQYIPVCYCYFLVFFTYCVVVLHRRKNIIVVKMWKPFSSIFSKTRRSLSAAAILNNALVVVYLLSFVKVLETSLLLLAPTYIYNFWDKHHVKAVYYYDGGLDYWKGGALIWHSVVAVFFLFVHSLLPPIFLFLYSIKAFRKTLKLDRLCTVSMIVNLLQQCYKDGTNGTKDCRWFSGIYFLLRILLFFVYVVLTNVLYHLPTLILMMELLLILTLWVHIIFSPYKRALYNQLDNAMLLLCVFIMTLTIIVFFLDLDDTRHPPIFVEILIILSFATPFIGAVIFIGYHIITRVLVCTRLSVKAWRSMRKIRTHSSSRVCLNEEPNFIEEDEFTDATPSLPDRLLHPSSYEAEIEGEDPYVHLSYNSCNQ